jgi:hypothetical protein
MRTLAWLWVGWFALSLGLGSVGCGRKKESAEAVWVNLLGTAYRQHWQAAGIVDEGRVAVEGSELVLGVGAPMTGAKFVGWPKLAMSGGYELRYEALREQGEDIFGMCTFPVPERGAHMTFVIGGWGGVLTGFSSIDFRDASENSTRAEQRFANGRWYKVRLEIGAEELKAWVEEKLVANVSIKGRQIGLRPGDVDHCLPMGFATWGTQGRIRGLQVRPKT